MGIRIIAGTCKGKKLATVRGLSTRPTAERLREAVFSILSFEMQGAVVLDLFAGTGALGIEALSRGAETAVFVDKDRRAVGAIEKNIRSCYMERRSTVYQWDISKNLNCLYRHGACFNVVFMDPPYERGLIQEALENLDSSRALVLGARVVVEHSPREKPEKNMAGYMIADQRKYGNSMVTFMDYKGCSTMDGPER